MARPAKITAEVVEFAAFARARRIPKSAIKRLLSERFGLKARSCETVFARAREEEIKASGKSIDQHRSEMFALFNSFIADKDVTVRNKLIAAEHLCKLLGLNRPDRIELSGPDGGAIEVKKEIDLTQLSDEELQVLLKLKGEDA